LIASGYGPGRYVLHVSRVTQIKKQKRNDGISMALRGQFTEEQIPFEIRKISLGGFLWVS
jgi:hypothetical protein